MKYLPARGVFFIHIPKCAGISVHKALDLEEADYDDFAADLGVDHDEAARLAMSWRFPAAPGTRREGGYVHHRLGRVHPIHLPLSYMADEMPRTWKALQGASHSFGLTRDPRKRFLSTLMQRATEFGDGGPVRIDDPALRDEAARVCDFLAAHDRFCDAEYSHFTRQVDYVEHEGRRVLRMVLSVERTDLLSIWLRESAGLDVVVPQAHARRQPQGWARRVVPVARLAGRRVVPRRLKKALFPIWMGSGLFSNAKSSYDTTRLSDDVERFIGEYYAADTALHDEATRRARMSETA